MWRHSHLSHFLPGPPEGPLLAQGDLWAWLPHVTPGFQGTQSGIAETGDLGTCCVFRGLHCGDRGVGGCLGDPSGVDSPFCLGGKQRETPCHPSTCARNHVTQSIKWPTLGLPCTCLPC